MTKKKKLCELKAGTFFRHKRKLYFRINPSEDYYTPWAVRVADGSGDDFYPPCWDFDPEIKVTPVKMHWRQK